MAIPAAMKYSVLRVYDLEISKTCTKNKDSGWSNAGETACGDCSGPALVRAFREARLKPFNMESACVCAGNMMNCKINETIHDTRQKAGCIAFSEGRLVVVLKRESVF
jgi:hypothetical protein